MKSGIIGIGFDMDDTLYRDPFGVPALARRALEKIALENVNAQSDSDLLELIRRGPEAWLRQHMLAENVGHNWIPTQEVWVEYCRRFVESISHSSCSNEMAARLREEWQKLGPPGRGSFRPRLSRGCYDMLWELRARGYRLGLCTNRLYDPSPVLERDSILGVFHCVVHSSVPGYEKPSPYLLLRFSDRVEANPSRCVYVGDRLDVDVMAAQRAGMIPVWASWNCSGVEDPPNSLLVAETPEDMLSMFP